MSLAAIKEAGPARAPREQCSIGLWLDSLSATDRVAAEAMIADTGWPTATLHKALTADPDVVGYTPASDKPLTDHRKRACRCNR